MDEYMTDYLERLDRPEMTYFKDAYKNSKRWTGEPLAGKTIIIYCEQGLGDTIQFARFFRFNFGASVIIHCDKSLHRLFLLQEDCQLGALDKDDPTLPPHDYHVLSMSLPFILKDYKPLMPYLKADPIPLGEYGAGRKIGICWEGNPNHPLNMERSCPLRFFKAMAKPDRKFFMLHKEVQTPELTYGCEDFELLSVPKQDMWDAARLIAAMDVVITVDTSILHLAGAMGKMTFGLLDKNYDYRWKVRNWYPTVALLFQGKKGDWVPVFAGIMMMIDTLFSSTEQKQPIEVSQMLGESFVSPDKA